MHRSSKRVSAFAVFKSTSRDGTPKTPSHKPGVRKPQASTPIVDILRQGQGQVMKKLRKSVRAKTKRSSKVPQGSGAKQLLLSTETASQPSGSKLPTPVLSASQVKELKQESGQRKRKSPHVTSPGITRSRRVKQQQQQQQQQPEPSAKRLKFQESEDSDIQAEPSSTEGILHESMKRDSFQHGKDVFSWLISPVKVDDFFKNLFERKPLFLKRHTAGYFKDVFSSEELHSILKENDVQFSCNLDVTTYTNGQRETHNPVGRANPQVVWDYYKNGCSVRVLNPQSYSTRVWQLLAALQEYFGCFVGANVYLTPPGSQGFAPHYDDIEAFVLQLEGKKNWKLYNPRSSTEVLPRFSSANFTDADIGAPILDTTLEAGDLLYFPRGIIHQANTPSETHSLHITISACQKNSWGDLMQHLLSRALHLAHEEDIEFRRALPVDYLSYTGVAHSDLKSEKRDTFMKKIDDLMTRLMKRAPVDAAVDQMATEFIHTSLPPALEAAEESCSIFGINASCQNGSVTGFVHLAEDTPVRLIRRNILRLVTDSDTILVHHSAENSRVYKEKELQSFEIPAEAAAAVEFLIHSYPEYVPVSDLPFVSDDRESGDQIDLAQLLFEKGVLVTKRRLTSSKSAENVAGRDVAIHQSF